MARRLMLLTLIFGLICAIPLSLRLSPVFADDNWSITDDNNGGTKTGGDTTKTGGDATKTGGDATKTGGTTGTPDATTPPAGTTAEPPAATPPASPARVIPSKAKMRYFLDDEKYADAEGAYLQWASYWREDDPKLIIGIERGMLLKEYKDGKFAALIALVESGDVEARGLLRAAVLAGGAGMPSEEFVRGIHFLGEIHDATALNMLRLSLYSEDKAVVIAAIDALGNIGDKRVAPDLYKMLDDADAARTVALARALGKLGETKQLIARFTPQLRFPLAGAKEKAALGLAALGDPNGWNILADMLSKKDKDYYPLVLTVLGELPSDESAETVQAALAGSEAEQLAAMQSLNILQPTQANRTLLALAKNPDAPVATRVAAIELLAQNQYRPAKKVLRALVSSLTGEVEPAAATGTKPVPVEGDATAPAAAPAATGDAAPAKPEVKPEAKPVTTVDEKSDAVDPAVKAAAIKAMVKFAMLDAQPVREMLRQRFDSPQEDVARAARVALLQYALDAMAAAAKK